MKTIRISKGGGRYREVVVPSAAEKARLRQFVPDLERRARVSDAAGVQHGFTRFRSPVTMALAHVGPHEWTWTADVASCFDNIRPHHVAGLMSEAEVAETFLDGCPKQGLPTSPCVCNLALGPVDKAIVAWFRGAGHELIYTRYADDLAISGSGAEVLAAVEAAVPRIVASFGFDLPARKCHLWRSCQGRRVICGVAVDADGIHPTRRTKRRLRAAEHQAQQRPDSWRQRARADGLDEWCALKAPAESGRERYAAPHGAEVRSVRKCEIGEVHRIALVAGRYVALDHPDEEVMCVEVAGEKLPLCVRAVRQVNRDGDVKAMRKMLKKGW